MILDGNMRFWEKVDKSGDCWQWTASCTPGGYGKFYFNGRLSTVHRLTYEDAYGPIPGGMVIDHRCHNRKCVNPAHLRLATPKQNAENKLGAQVNSKSGVRGVYKDGDHPNWTAQIRHNNRGFHIGNFPTLAEAEAAVIAKRNELFSHNDSDRGCK